MLPSQLHHTRARYHFLCDLPTRNPRAQFLLTLPRSWVYNFEDPETLLADYDLMMDGVAEWRGFPPEVRRRYGVQT